MIRMYSTLVIVLSVIPAYFGLLHGEHICERTDMYNETTRVLVKVPVRIRTLTWCMNFPPRCSKYHTEMKDTYRIETSEKSRIVLECCPGYGAPDNETCSPLCPGGCGDGTCGAPGSCLCPEGLTGPQCEDSVFPETTTSPSYDCQEISSEDCSRLLISSSEILLPAEWTSTTESYSTESITSSASSERGLQNLPEIGHPYFENMNISIQPISTTDVHQTTVKTDDITEEEIEQYEMTTESNHALESADDLRSTPDGPDAQHEFVHEETTEAKSVDNNYVVVSTQSTEYSDGETEEIDAVNVQQDKIKNDLNIARTELPRNVERSFRTESNYSNGSGEFNRNNGLLKNMNVTVTAGQWNRDNEMLKNNISMTTMDNYNDNDRHLMSAISIAAGVGVAVIFVSLVIIFTKKMRRSKMAASHKDSPSTMQTSHSNNDVLAAIQMYSRASFQLSLPDPPIFENPVFCSTTEDILRRPVIYSQACPNCARSSISVPSREVLEGFYDHPQSPLSCCRPHSTFRPCDMICGDKRPISVHSHGATRILADQIQLDLKQHIACYSENATGDTQDHVYDEIPFRTQPAVRARFYEM